MTDIALIFSSLKSRWLNSLLSVFLTAFGVMLALLIIQFGHHIQNRITTDGKNIDIVVGAKGSPLQLILSSVYHIDIPTGNIAYDQAQKWMKHPHVKTAIPLALGDNWKGYRIVGTTPDYLTHYQATILEGRVWNKDYEAIAGSSVGLQVGEEFSGAHGLIEGGHKHDSQHYTITGIIEPTGTVLDRLILTSMNSVLDIHGLAPASPASPLKNANEAHSQEDHNHDHDHHEHDEHEHHEHEHHEHEHHDHAHMGEPEITALLLTTKSPIANINLPRSINKDTNLQAANPALEMARLTSMMGLGSQSFAALSTLLIIIASLSIFAGLAGSLENRMSDLAVLRAIGYSKQRVFKIIALEGFFIVLAGIVIGFIMGLAGFILASHVIAPLAASGAQIIFTPDYVWVILAVILAGFIAAFIPAWRASHIDVARQLARKV